MKTKYSMFGVLVAIALVVSLIIPGNLASPTPASADAGICKWSFIDMPGSNLRNDLVINPFNNVFYASESEKLVTTANPDVILAQIDTDNGTAGNIDFYASIMKGVQWPPPPNNHLKAALAAALVPDTNRDVWNIAAAPDDPNFWAVVTGNAANDDPVNVWVTNNAGGSWQDTQADIATGNLLIGAIDISPSYGGKRDIAIGLRSGTNAGYANPIYVVQSGGYTGWVAQDISGLNNVEVPIDACDILDLMFSPTYVGDAGLAIVFADNNGTYFNVGLRDLSTLNDIVGWAYSASIEVMNPTSIPGGSPDASQIVVADLELPSDFSGQSASLRRAYISTDDGGDKPNPGTDTGIYRIDDTTVYTLMDTSASPIFGKRIHSIAYYGTYASGKLLAGEVVGEVCTATVPTWFTDSPTVCPVPCWYPALKPTTGAAGVPCAWDNWFGNADVIWSTDGTLAYVATSSWGEMHGPDWNELLDLQPIQYDESAIAVSRNNGETWNQIGFIDTYIFQFTDVAITADCTTIYLASLNNLEDGENCTGFDSVWRTSVNDVVVSPFPSFLPLGYFYERVYCRVNAIDCEDDQSMIGLLRLPPPGPNCDNGMVVGWAAWGTRAEAWSPDYGDYWAQITARNDIQDFAFESPTLLYNLSPGGVVQKMPYTGTAWSSAVDDTDTMLGAGHTIAAQPEGKVVVGAGAMMPYPASVSMDSAASWLPLTAIPPTRGNFHVAFDPDFDNNKTYYIADDTVGSGTVYRAAYPGISTSLADLDMMSAANGACGCAAPHPIGIYGIQLAYTGGALYAAHNGAVLQEPPFNDAAVCRALWPLSGMPKPGMVWNCMAVALNRPATYEAGVRFDAEPWSLKICGCCTMDTNTKVWALDNREYVPYPTPFGDNQQGFLWGFEDCLAKKGPALITQDGELIGCDPVTGRAQEVNLCWEQLCVAAWYDIEIAKDKDFTIRVLDYAPMCSPDPTVNVDEWLAMFLRPVEVLKPCVYIPAGGILDDFAGSSIAYYGQLECGHTYYWRVMARACATGQVVHSQWSETRSFTVKAGLPVRADYYGLKLLSPDNGCLGCPVQPASFSWSPFKETTKYKFVLAKDAAMTQVVAEAEVPTTAYEYNGTLDYSTNYFWRVMSLEPAPSDWSATFSFQTEAAPPPPAAPEEAPATPIWVWVIIAIGAILVIVTLVLIFKTRRA